MPSPPRKSLMVQQSWDQLIGRSSLLRELSTPTPTSSHLLASEIPEAIALLPNLAHVSGLPRASWHKMRKKLCWRIKHPLLHMCRPHSQGPIIITM